MGTKQQPTTEAQSTSATTAMAEFGAGIGLNEAVVVGQMVAEPERRTLPSGSVAASFSLTVRQAGRKTTSVPVVWYDPPKRLNSWRVGDMVTVRGQIVRRFFRGSGGLGSSTEVVAEQAELVRHRTKAASLLDRTRGELAAWDPDPG